MKLVFLKFELNYRKNELSAANLVIKLYRKAINTNAT